MVDCAGTNTLLVLLICLIAAVLATPTFNIASTTPIDENGILSFHGSISLGSAGAPFSVINTITFKTDDHLADDFTLNTASLDAFLYPSGVVISHTNEIHNFISNTLDLGFSTVKVADLAKDNHILVISGSITTSLRKTASATPTVKVVISVTYNTNLQLSETVSAAPYIDPSKASTYGQSSRDLLATITQHPTDDSKYTHSFLFPALYNPNSVEVSAVSITLGGAWFYKKITHPTDQDSPALPTCSIFGTNSTVAFMDCLPTLNSCQTIILPLSSPHEIKHNLPLDIICTTDVNFFLSTGPTNNTRYRQPFIGDVTVKILSDIDEKTEKRQVIDFLTAFHTHVHSAIPFTMIPESTTVQSYLRPASAPNATCDAELLTTTRLTYAEYGPLWDSGEALILNLHNLRRNLDNSIDVRTFLPELDYVRDPFLSPRIYNVDDFDRDHIIYSSIVKQHELTTSNAYRASIPLHPLFTGFGESFYSSSEVPSFVIESTQCINHAEVNAYNVDYYAVTPMLAIMVTDLYTQTPHLIFVPLSTKQINFDVSNTLVTTPSQQMMSGTRRIAKQRFPDLTLLQSLSFMELHLRFVVDSKYDPLQATHLQLHSYLGSTQFAFETREQNQTAPCVLRDASGKVVITNSTLARQFIDEFETRDKSSLGDMIEVIIPPTTLIPGTPYSLSCAVTMQWSWENLMWSGAIAARVSQRPYRFASHTAFQAAVRKGEYSALLHDDGITTNGYMYATTWMYVYYNAVPAIVYKALQWLFTLILIVIFLIILSCVAGCIFCCYTAAEKRALPPSHHIHMTTYDANNPTPAQAPKDSNGQSFVPYAKPQPRNKNSQYQQLEELN